MTTTARPFTIVVGVDLDQAGNHALQQAIAIAGLMHDAIVHAVYIATRREASTEADVPHPGSDQPPTEAEVALGRLERLCRESVAAAQAADDRVTFRRLVTHVRVGMPAEVLADFAKDFDADLVVVGTNDRRGLKRLVLGSVAESTMRRASCPVLVARLKDHEHIGEVPAIEPPCPDCVAIQTREHNPKLWCPRHELAKYHPAAHRYSYVYDGGSGVVGKPMGSTPPGA